MQIAVFVLAAGCTGGLLTAVFYPRLAGDRQTNTRRQAIMEGLRSGQAGAKPDSHRKRSLEDVLREIEAKQREKTESQADAGGAHPPGGPGWSKSTYLAFAPARALRPSPWQSCSWACIRWWRSGSASPAGCCCRTSTSISSASRRFKRFTEEFANAMDIIVRGLKAGLPLADCMKIIAAEAQEPVKGEFRAVIEDQAMGMPADEAVQRMPGRMPVAEASFFAIVIAIQSRTGGSLSEALGNLSKVLRERKKMRAKIVAMSSEAKSSAGIIGALPVFVTGAIYFTTPDYIALLFTTSAGNIILAVSGFWMLMGILVMRKMINFDF
jgi:tight adherence protein B